MMDGISAFPSPAPEFSTQEDRREYVHAACEGQPPARRKKLIMDARLIGLIDDADVTIFLDAHGVSAE